MSRRPPPPAAFKKIAAPLFPGRERERVALNYVPGPSRGNVSIQRGSSRAKFTFAGMGKRVTFFPATTPGKTLLRKRISEEREGEKFF